MALNWNVGKVKDFKTVCYNADGKVNAVTETLIWASMIIGVSDITEKNAEEFFFRITMRERLHGALRRDWSGENPVDVFVTWDEVKAHIGLGTNATNMTRAKFVKHTVNMFERDMVFIVRNAETVA
jgi:hypothetical protein